MALCILFASSRAHAQTTDQTTDQKIEAVVVVPLVAAAVASVFVMEATGYDPVQHIFGRDGAPQIPNGPGEPASYRLNGLVCAGIAASVSGFMNYEDVTSNHSPRYSDTEMMVAPMIAYLSAAAIMETYTATCEGPGNGRYAPFKVGQVLAGTFGAGLVTTVGGAGHHVAMALIPPTTPKSSPSVAVVMRW